MDLKTKEDIQFHALSAFSENLVKARQRLESMNAQMRDPETDLAVKAELTNNIRASIQLYDSFRIKQAKKKREVLNSLCAKYPLIKQEDILRCLDTAINEYEIQERELNTHIIIATKTSTQATAPASQAAAPPAPTTQAATPAAPPAPASKGTKPLFATNIVEQSSITIPAYKTPSRSDMAVLLVYFNALSYKKLAQNLCLIYHTLTRAGIPVYLVEHCFKDQTPLFPENGTTIFNTRSDSYMFYKENLLNWLMPKVPAQYTKFFMMDCDLLFDKDTWYDDVSVLLDTHDAVHPFENAVWLGSDLKTVDLKKISIVAGRDNSDLGLKLMHPGFAWAFRRDFIEPRGVFDINIMGSGDTILASSVIQINKNHGPWQTNSLDWIIEEFNKYFMKFRDNRSTFYRQTVYHLWHGSQILRRNNKRYTDFKTACSEHSINTKDDIFALNKYGLYEYTEPVRDTINNIFLEFFETRDEDSV